MSKKKSRSQHWITRERDASKSTHLLDGELLVRPRLEIRIRIPLRWDDDEPRSPVSQAIVQLLSISSHEVVALIEKGRERGQRGPTNETRLLPRTLFQLKAPSVSD